jgi:viroplasmin and RNaseH domain-containing protein
MTRGDVATLPEEICKETIAEWNDATGDYVRDKMFAKMQFVTDADLVTGGKVEFLVTKELHINGEERKRLFWEVHGGRATVRNTIRKKRQTAQNAMKLAFRGKFLCCSVTAMLVGLILNC